jgi:hypothetical protein
MTFCVKYRAVRVCIKYLAPFILLNCAVLFWLRNLRGNEAPIESGTDQLQKLESRIPWSNNVVPTTAAASTFFQVDIQSRAPIGEYLWNHLIEGKKELLSHQVIYKGTKTNDILISHTPKTLFLVILGDDADILRLFKELNLESLCYLKMSNT